LQKIPELDLAIAHHIGIRRAPFAILVKKILKHFLHILFLKIHRKHRDPDRVAHPSHILGIFLCRTAAEIIGVIPIFHKYADHVVASLLQEQRRHGRIDAPRHADDDPLPN
jgi:hypothetical protein